MKKFNVVAFVTTRHELKVEAEDETAALSVAEETDVEKWTEDMEYYEFDIHHCEEIREKKPLPNPADLDPGC